MIAIAALLTTIGLGLAVFDGKPLVIGIASFGCGWSWALTWAIYEMRRGH